MRFTTAAAYTGFGYLVATLVYLLLVPMVGSPLRDSLSADQRRISRRSGQRRLLLFVFAATASGAILAAYRPFT